MGSTVENSIRDGNDQLVMKDETKDLCRVTESIQKQHGKISKPTSHFTSPHNMVTICHQDTITGQDNDHLHLTDSHFSEDDQICDNSSSVSHDTGSISLSNTISSVDLTTWGPDVRRHDQSGRSMGSTATTAVVTTRRRLAPASQVWQDVRHYRTFNVLTPHLSTTKGERINVPDRKTARNVSKDSRRRSAISGRRRRFYARKLWIMWKWPEGRKNRRTELSDPLKDGLGHEPDLPLSNR